MPRDHLRASAEVFLAKEELLQVELNGRVVGEALTDSKWRVQLTDEQQRELQLCAACATLLMKRAEEEAEAVAV